MPVRKSKKSKTLSGRKPKKKKVGKKRKFKPKRVVGALASGTMYSTGDRVIISRESPRKQKPS